jgi:hypothetical protein
MDGLKSLVGWILLIVGGIGVVMGFSHLAEGIYANVTNGKASPDGPVYIVTGVLALPFAWAGFRLARGKRFILALFGVARPPK